MLNTRTRRFGPSPPSAGHCAILAYVAFTNLANPRLAIAAGLVVCALGAGCAPTIVPGVPAAELPFEVRADPDLARQVPEAVAADGLLNIGTDPAYPPMEFIEDGLLHGVDIQLAQAVAAKLGLVASFTMEAFTALEPGVRAGRFELGAAALSLAPGESMSTDAVLYLASGTRLARRAGSGVELTRMCGHPVAALEGSAQVEDLAAESKECEAGGSLPITVLAKEDLSDVTKAVLSGVAHAMVADSPVVQAVTREHAAELELTPDTAFPDSLALLTAPSLGELVVAALGELIAEGTYDAILHGNGLTEGAVDAAVLVPAGQPAGDLPVASRPVAQR